MRQNATTVVCVSVYLLVRETVVEGLSYGCVAQNTLPAQIDPAQMLATCCSFPIKTLVLFCVRGEAADERAVLRL